MMTAFGKGQQ